MHLQLLTPLLFFFYLLCSFLPVRNAGALEASFLEPLYKNGVFSTTKGGVLSGPHFRLQAKNISYEKTDKGYIISADTELLLQYKDSFYVAESLFFDTNSKKIFLTKATTYEAPFYIDAETVEIAKAGTFIAEGVRLTSVEFGRGSWELRTKRLYGKKNGSLLYFDGVSMRLFSAALYLPSFSLNLEKFSPSILRYRCTWDRCVGPRFSVRYRAHSWEALALFLRGEYRWKTGFGAALETEYFPQNSSNFLLTKNYIASDVIPKNLEKKRRFRLQGLGSMEGDKTAVAVSWDKYSDPLMPGDFHTPDFEINTKKNTFFSVFYKGEGFLVKGMVRPKINSFQTVYEKLPQAFLQTKSYKLGGFIGNTFCKASWDRFSYADTTNHLPNFSAGRLVAKQHFLRRSSLGALLTSASVGLEGSIDTSSRKDQLLAQALISCALEAKFSGRKNLGSWLHQIEPFSMFSADLPTRGVDERYVFSVEEGSIVLKQLQCGMKNLFFHHPSSTRIRFSVYSRHFFCPNPKAFSPKRIHTKVSFEKENFALSCDSSCPVDFSRIDDVRAFLECTINKDIAFSLGGLYRSSFSFRKARKDNYFLENARSLPDLLLSPLSDRRAIILGKLFYRFTPFSSVEFSIKGGFLRTKEPSYLEYRLEAKTWIVAGFEARFTFERTENNERFSFGIEGLRY